MSSGPASGAADSLRARPDLPDGTIVWLTVSPGRDYGDQRHRLTLEGAPGTEGARKGLADSPLYAVPELGCRTVRRLELTIQL